LDRSKVLDESKHWWLAGSLPLGAGQPDIVAVNYQETIGTVDKLGRESVELLAYLRAVRQARLETVTERLQLSFDVAESTVDCLCEAGALDCSQGVLTLTSSWRELLPEVVAIEFKVSDWRRALTQATRNLLFAHRSFIALPPAVATRVRSSSAFGLQGVGIISVPEDRPSTIIRRARSGAPRSWQSQTQRLTFRNMNSWTP